MQTTLAATDQEASIHPTLTHRAKLALYLVAGGATAKQAAEQMDMSAAYLSRLASSVDGGAFIASVETDARRERARALFEASARKTVFAELVDDLMDAR